MENKVIVMTACRRPEYTKKVLESLSLCKGIEDYLFLPYVEPINEEVIKALYEVDFCSTQVHVNMKRYGHTLNTHHSLTMGFALSDYVILIEDDTLLAPDFLLFHEFAKERFKDDPDIFTISAGHYHEPERIHEPELLHAYKKHDWFSNQGWGTWRDRWLEEDGMHEVWENPEYVDENNYVVQYKYGGWDALLNKIHRKERKEIIPVVSRVLNIGVLEGVHSITEEDFDKTVRVKDWAGMHNSELDLTGEKYFEKK
jgi:hypothetical protein